MLNDIQEFYCILPFIILGTGILISVLIEMYSSNSERILPWFSIIIFGATGFYSLFAVDSVSVIMQSMIQTGGIPNIFHFIFNFGAAVSTSIDIITVQFPALSHNILFLAGVLLFFIGFSFKIAAFPFHMWVPDVYQGSATTIAGLFSTGGKAAAFSAIIASLSALFGGSLHIFLPYLAVISVLSMLFGSIVAIAQDNIKRMLAYSSIAHAGYMIIGPV